MKITKSVSNFCYRCMLNIQFKFCLVCELIGIKCSLCMKSFIKIRKFRKHNCDNSIAKKCSKFFGKVDSRRVLVCEVHSNEHKCVIFVCTKCKLKFKQKEECLSHFTRIHTKKKFECAHCESKYATKQSLRNHLTRHLEISHLCHICGEFFSERSHMNQHRDNRKYMCSSCPKRFRMNGLRQHERSHFREKIYACDVCGKSFAFNFALNKHRACHREKQFECAHCGNRYRWKYDLKLHTRKHLELKPFTCEQCGRSFTKKSVYSTHRFTHSVISCFSCHCGKHYKHRASLHRHMATHKEIFSETKGAPFSMPFETKNGDTLCLGKFYKMDELVRQMWNNFNIWWFGNSVVVTIVTYFLYNYLFGNSVKSLYGKVVLITGASSGLGEALAHAFHDAGCRVILASRNEVSLHRVKNELSLKPPGKVSTFPAVVMPIDLTNIDYLEEYAKEVVSIYDRIDILINNAGISYRGLIVSTTTEVDYKVMLVNYLAPVALTKGVLPVMMEQSSGHVVFVSSVQGRFALPFRSAYTVSKHALQAFGDTLRSEVADYNIEVTTVSPGYIRTNLSINAVTGNGKRYGVMDDTTAAGYPAPYVANKILWAVVNRNKEKMIAPYYNHLVVYLRTMCPSLYFFLMRLRARSHRSLADKRK